MWATLNNRQASNNVFVALMAVLILLAWLSLWLSDRSHDGMLHSLHGLHAFAGGVELALVFIAGWTVMIVAMMLPTSLPLVLLFRAVVRQRRDRTLLTALLVVGYLATWTLFGMIVYSGGWALQEIIGRSAWLGANAWVLGAGVLGLAGAYQFTPLKYHCLDKCRSPLSFVTEHWQGSRERSQSFRLGVHHGVFCVGCCWSLMLLMFLVGAAGALLWMLVLGAVMAVEKNVSWGRRMSAPLGVLLIGAALALGAGPLMQSPDDTTIRVPLAFTDGSSVSGTALFTDTFDGAEVRLDVEGLPEPGATYLAHLHPGSCTEEPSSSVGHHNHHGDHAAASFGEIEHPLVPITSDPGGAGTSTTVVEDVAVARLFSDTELYINVHAEASSSENSSTLACGDLRDEVQTTERNHEEEHHVH